MSAPQFTPGPWSTKQYGYEKHSVTDERGTEIGFAHRLGDARLIAAAPEIYEALNLYREWIAYHDVGVPQELANTVGRALAKARGEA